jgi:hypothetical protein
MNIKERGKEQQEDSNHKLAYYAQKYTCSELLKGTLIKPAQKGVDSSGT